eukprot:643667-Prymnesium_polylepis.1
MKSRLSSSAATRTSRLMWCTTVCSRYLLKGRLGYSTNDAEGVCLRIAGADCEKALSSVEVPIERRRAAASEELEHEVRAKLEFERHVAYGLCCARGRCRALRAPC